MIDEIGRFRRPNLFSMPVKNTQALGFLGLTKLQFVEKLIPLVNLGYFS